MYSVVAFIATTIELAGLLAAYLLHLKKLFIDIILYGSPFYTIQNIISSGSILHEKNILYLGFLIFHVSKYFVISQAQRLEEMSVVRTLAILFEVIYIGICAHYLL